MLVRWHNLECPTLPVKPPPGCYYEEFMGKDGCPHYTFICDPCATISCRLFMICVEDEDNKPKCICKKGYLDDPDTGNCISKPLSMWDTQSFRLCMIERSYMSEGLSWKYRRSVACEMPGMHILPRGTFQIATVLDCTHRRYTLSRHQHWNLQKEYKCDVSECPPPPPAQPGCRYEEYMGIDGCPKYELVCDGELITN